MRYVALLRGINVGGHKPVKMIDLRTAFESVGFQDVKTILASGNVVFEAPPPTSPHDQGPAQDAGAARDDIGVLAGRIEQHLRQTFGYSITVVLRTLADLGRLVDSDPFRGVALTPATRLYVTFLSPPAKIGRGIIPDASDAGDTHESGMKIVRVTPMEVCSVLTLSPTRGTTDLMVLLEKEFGAGVTTRNWNTITKIVGG